MSIPGTSDIREGMPCINLLAYWGAFQECCYYNKIAPNQPGHLRLWRSANKTLPVSTDPRGPTEAVDAGEMGWGRGRAERHNEGGADTKGGQGGHNEAPLEQEGKMGQQQGWGKGRLGLGLDWVYPPPSSTMQRHPQMFTACSVGGGGNPTASK